MNKKFVYGWWIPKEDQHFENYFSTVIQVGDKRLYQPKHIDRCFHHIKNRKNTAIDIGGHCGFWSFYLGKIFKKVYAFEPAEIFRECFKKKYSLKMLSYYQSSYTISQADNFPK